MLYRSCTSDDAWNLVCDMFPAPSKVGRPREHSTRDIVDGILYVVDNGTKWRSLPNDFPHWSTVYHYFRTWSASGLWEEVSQVLTGLVRLVAGRVESPSLASIDSQSQTAEPGVSERGLDGGKKSQR